MYVKRKKNRSDWTILQYLVILPNGPWWGPIFTMAGYIHVTGNSDGRRLVLQQKRLIILHLTIPWVSLPKNKKLFMAPALKNKAYKLLFLLPPIATRSRQSDSANHALPRLFRLSERPRSLVGWRVFLSTLNIYNNFFLNFIKHSVFLTKNSTSFSRWLAFWCVGKDKHVIIRIFQIWSKNFSSILNPLQRTCAMTFFGSSVSLK